MISNTLQYFYDAEGNQITFLYYSIPVKYLWVKRSNTLLKQDIWLNKWLRHPKKAFKYTKYWITGKEFHTLNLLKEVQIYKS